MNFIKRSACEITGQPSSKRVTAYEYGLLGAIIILTLCFVIIYVVVKNEDIKPSVQTVMLFLGGGVLVSVLAFILKLLDIATEQNKEAIKAKIVTDLNQVIPQADTTVIQQ